MSKIEGGISYKNRECLVLSYVKSYGLLAEADQKQWLIDQAVRILCGTEKNYESWVSEYDRNAVGSSWKLGVRLQLSTEGKSGAPDE
jgi:hypothetical protein